MPNPWKSIPAADYEAHMSSPSVRQLQALNEIFRRQYLQYNPSSLAIFGVSTGNGLEHVNSEVTQNVYGVDVNEEYLKICRERFSKQGYTLHLYEVDVNEKSVEFSPTDLIVENLFLEYVELKKFLEQVRILSHPSTVLSVVIQVSNDESFVSRAEFKSLEVLSDFHHNIKATALIESLKRRKFKLLLKERYVVPNGKEFVRLDFFC